MKQHLSAMKYFYFYFSFAFYFGWQGLFKFHCKQKATGFSAVPVLAA